MQLIARTADGTRVNEGDEVVDHRGTPATFVRVTRAASTGKSAKVLVEDESRRQREYYERVFGLTVTEED